MNAYGGNRRHTFPEIDNPLRAKSTVTNDCDKITNLKNLGRSL